ncbi:MAG TPA: flagellar basal body L-ring protein FlgH [Polyangiaceae bacterium]|nr:flagellar basal body L-ring protein FlgH [Polyangiaceae bacterium]
MNRSLLFVIALVAAELSAACGPSHIAPFTPRERKYQPGPYAANQKNARPAVGSIYSEAQAGFLEDTRALRVGDVVLIRIREEADAQGGATTKLSKETNREAGVSNLLGLVPAIRRAYPNIEPDELIALAARADFAGEGQTQRAGKLRGSIGVHVKQELPNGDLFVEGTKVVMINHEEYHLYVSGVVRPADIEGDNSVDSALIADARVEFTGRGDIDDQVERGWLTKILDTVSPF